MDIQRLIRQFQQKPNWKVATPKGLPRLNDEIVETQIKIPTDILQFFDLCGGLEWKEVRDDGPIVRSFHQNILHGHQKK